MSSWWMAVVALLGPVGGEMALPTYMVGMVTQQYDQKCLGLDGYEVEWVNPHMEIGFSPVAAGKGVALDGMAGEPVLAKVAAAPGKETKVEPVKEGMFAHSCVPMQMRDDWIPAKEGIRMLRSLKAGQRWKGLQVVEARKIKPVELVKSGPDAVATVQNDLGFPLEGVDLVFHYEGCYGKPGTTVQVREIGEMKPGEKKEVRAPLVVERERTRGVTREMEHILVSVQLVASSTGVVVDLDIPISYWHLPLECPEQ